MRFPNYAYDYQLIIKQLFNRIPDWRPNQKIFYRDKFSYTYKEFYKRVHKLANLLKSLGVEKGDMVAVMDWDSHRYLEAYFAVPMMGAILHMINIRLAPEQLLYTINHAEDKIIIMHKDFEPLIKKVAGKFETVEKIIYINDWEDFEIDKDYLEQYVDVVGEYEELIEKQSDEFEFEDFDENTIATTFYTTGTTGDPKGVFFTHRQLVLHTITALGQFGGMTEPAPFNQFDVYMPLTPMFHVHAWGVPYIATILGVKQIYPGRYDDMLVKLLVQHKVTFSHCVPTILQMILSNPATKQLDFSNWKVVIGGSALSKGLAKAAMERGIRIMTGYGMSETAPILTLAVIKPEQIEADFDTKVDIVTKTGFPEPLVQIKIVDDNMNELPRGKVGEIVTRAPWLTAGYYKVENKSKELWRGGWLHTGDIGYINDEGYLKITDRLKDVIKTGGEWVSSLDLENMISQCDNVLLVGVIGVPDDKWGERPIAFIQPKDPQTADKIEETCRKHLMTYVEAGTIEKWAIPDKFIILDQMPKTSVGKIDKKVLRKLYAEKFSK